MEWCSICKRSFASDQALQQHIQDAPAHTLSYDRDACDRSLVSEQALQQQKRKTTDQSTLKTKAQAMAKKKNLVTEPATNAALQWHFGIVTEPPSDRVGKEYLAQHLPKCYHLEGDTLIVRKIGLLVAPKQLAANQAKAKKSFHIVRADFARQAASKQTLEDRPNEMELVEGPSTPDAVASPASQALVTVPDERLAVDWSGLIQPDLWTHEYSLVKACSSFTINDRAAAFNYQLAFLSDSGSRSNVAQPSDNGSREATRTTPLFSGKMLDGSGSGTFNQYGLLCKAVATRESQHLPESTTSKLPHVFNDDPRIFLNMNAPWSIFICGSQGSDKSYTLSYILENYLIPLRLGQLSSPLTVIIFHYDTFTSYESRQLYETAYLCSSDMSVKVLVSPTNF